MCVDRAGDAFDLDLSGDTDAQKQVGTALLMQLLQIAVNVRCRLRCVLIFHACRPLVAVCLPA